VTHFLNGLAQAAAPSGGGGLFGSGSMMVPLLLMFAIFYFLILRPQSKKAKELQKLLSELKKGDDVVTQGGIIGKISGLKDNELTLQLQEGVRVRVLRSAVTGIYTGGGGGAQSAAKADKPETKSEAKASS
jgi:preprotein translocase subunit YajC